MKARVLVASALATGLVVILVGMALAGGLRIADVGRRSVDEKVPSFVLQPASTMTTTAACLAFDGTGVVNAVDVQTIAARWRQQSTDPGWNAQFDPNGDGIITVADVMQVAAAWGTPCPQPPLPPDPATVASPINRTAATNLADTTAFLYSGANPIQTGVVSGTIEARRVAVLRGRVLASDGTALPAVTISVLNHPEYGQTLSRADGMFDLAVNGGGLLTLSYARNGYLPVQRPVDVPWQDYVMLPDVVLVPYDPHVTVIDLTSSAAFQVARGSVISDTDGMRQPTLLFPQGLTVTMVLSGGVTQPLTPTLHVRATEYTIGPMGPAAMPGDLPANSGYTHATEFTVAEAVAAGATDVHFSQPVISYVENFLSFTVGISVPVGYYDKQQGVWVASDSGRVIKILSVTDGKADLDVDGTGQAANAATLAALGITDPERAQLASLYAVGVSLWRVPITHFSGWDSNWPFAPPPDAGPPSGPPPAGSGCNCDCPDNTAGSIIGCQGQTLGEAVNVPGTPFFLRYSSDRTAGYKADYTLNVPVSGITVPTSLKRIDLEISVAGQTFTQTLPAAADQTYRFAWDGTDAYSRTLQGRQPAVVDIGYVYDGVYQRTDRFGYNGDGTPITGSRTRQEVTLHRIDHTFIGPWDARGEGLGGWTLSVHHAYDPQGRTLYLGSGERRSALTINAVINTSAGNGAGAFSGDGGPAAQASFFFPQGVAVGPDGSVYIADTGNAVVRRVDASGIITTVVGMPGVQCSPITAPCGDGGPARQAQLHSPESVALGPDGSLYIADPGANRVRKVSPNGIISTVAGTGQPCAPSTAACGDGGPATQAQLNQNQHLAVAPDGTLYVTDGGSHRVRRVGTDGIISTVAGSGNPPSGGCSNDGVNALNACLDFPWGVAAMPDGSIEFSDVYLHQIFRVQANGIINVVAGDGTCGANGDGGPASQARLCDPEAVARGPDNSLYIADWGNSRIRRIGPDGIISTVAGNGTAGFSGDSGPAVQGQINHPIGVTFGVDGNIYIADGNNQRIRRVSPPLPGFTGNDFAIPSDDGSELYQFDYQGRHLRTINTLTGANLYVFTYDSDGRLVEITDGDGNVTTIERDGAGNPTAIVGPYGQRTTLSLDTNGYFSKITNPAGQFYQYSYTADGLMTSQITPRGYVYTYTYDTLGGLAQDSDPAGGFKSLARTDGVVSAGVSVSYTVALTTALGRKTSYQFEVSGTGDQQRVNTLPSGLQTELTGRADGTSIGRTPDGVVTTSTLQPDPRWQMQAPLASQTIHTPEGLNQTVQTNRTVTLANPANPLSLTTMTDLLSINGKTYTNVFDAATRTFNTTSPAGRQSSRTIDTQGRTLQSQVSGLLPTNYVYDSHGRLVTATRGTGADTRTASFGYDSDGYLQTVTNPLSQTVSFGYDAVGRVLTQTLADGRMILYSYDSDGNVTSITPPGQPVHAFSYTPIDLTSVYTAPVVGAIITPTLYTYNADHQPILITRPDGQTVSLGYDGAGRLITVTVPGGQYGYGYDVTTGNLITTTAPGGERLDYSYDGSLLRGVGWTGTISGFVVLGYDNFFRLASLQAVGSPVTYNYYDDDSLLVQAGDILLSRDPQNGLLTGTTLDVVTDTITYNGFGEPVGYRAAYNGTDMFDQQVARDKLGRITVMTETISATTGVYSYTYDLAGRLTQVVSTTGSISYTYDDNGNRLSKTDPSGTITAAYDAQDRLTTYATTVYTYTANGELQSKTTDGQTTTYEYDVLGNLKAVTLPDSTHIDYLVDGQNQRIGKKVNGSLVQGFLYQDKLNPIAELDGSNNVVSRFVYASRDNVPDYMIKDGVTYRIIADSLGSPRLVVDVGTGAVAQRLDYDEFGRVITDTNPGFQPFGFAGGLYDPDTGLVRFGARDYDAETGRWTAKDPILFGGGQVNLYGYVLNDPINLVDLSGLKVVNTLPGPHGTVYLTDTPQSPCPNCQYLGSYKDCKSGVTLYKWLEPPRPPQQGGQQGGQGSSQSNTNPTGQSTPAGQQEALQGINTCSRCWLGGDQGLPPPTLAPSQSSEDSGF
jgi:RHS repeat-associated protein